ncbi:MAG: hypothetical protein HY540_00445, partial [Deltaproteobacteria bacterium]|nr:hypothetical protein [Deltaproteobacteria bacterium]
MKRLLLTVVFLVLPQICFSYPSEVLSVSGGPPFNFTITSGITGFQLISDSRLAVSFSETLMLIDLAAFAKESTQPAALTADDEIDGNILGLAYDANANDILASQQDGDVLFFDLDDVSALPKSVTVSADKRLGPIAVDTTNRRAIVANNSDRTLHVIDLASRVVQGTITLALGIG